jgi:hypothetical protein
MIPVPPTNVSLIYDDGRRVAVECAFVGYVNRIATWRVVSAPPGEVVGVRVDVLPAYSSIQV